MDDMEPRGISSRELAEMCEAFLLVAAVVVVGVVVVVLVLTLTLLLLPLGARQS